MSLYDPLCQDPASGIRYGDTLGLGRGLGIAGSLLKKDEVIGALSLPMIVLVLPCRWAPLS